MFKRIVKIILIMCVSIVLFACAKKESAVDNAKYVELAKNFYTEYLKEFENFDGDFIGRLASVKKKYMTDIMIEEMEIRNKQTDSDSIIEAQDGYGMINIIDVKNGKEPQTAQVVFDDETNNIKRIFDLHFREESGKTLIDTIDSTVIGKDVNGKLVERTNKTKYANKETLSDDDKKEMESIRKYYDELAEQGFIG